MFYAQIAQLVEQRTENPRVAGSIPALGIFYLQKICKRDNMKILLAAVNAKYIHSNLAVYSLKAAAQQYRNQVEIAEYTINQRMDDILKDIYKRKPDVLAFSCYIWNIRLVGELIEEISGIMPKVDLWVGGPEVTHRAVKFLESYPHIKGVMRGEGEKIFTHLVWYYIENKGSLGEINGITWRDEQGLIHEETDESPAGMDDLPFAYTDLELFSGKIIYYESSRGCPFQCSYCLSSVDKGVRFRSLDLVKKELQVFLAHRVSQVKFVDRTFNCDTKRTEELFRWMLAHDNGVTNFHFEISADLISETELELMSRMRPGMIQLEIGVQTTNADTLQAIHRTMNFEKLKSIVSRVKSFGNIHQHLDLIAGLPYEDIESFQRSFDDVFSMRPEQLQLGFLKVLSGTEMEKKMEEYGILCHHLPPYEVLSTNWMSYEDILALKGVEEMVEVYYNSHQFERTLEEILKDYKSPFAFFQKLAIYYEDRNYNKVSHTRMARYEILREFLREKRQDIFVYEQCMVYDLYAREKLKSRPDFAVSLTPYKKRLREYAAKYGKKVHIEVFECPDGLKYVLFDYDKRNPLTKEAHVELLEKI